MDVLQNTYGHGAALNIPQATSKAEILTPLAAVGLGLLQAGALHAHARRREFQVVAVNVVLIALAAFVAIGRFAGWGE